MTIVVTGGSKGIGRGIAERFATEGAHVIVSYAHDDAAAAAAKDSIEHLGGTASLVKVDLATPAGVTELAERVRGLTDRVDQLVHGAVWPLRTRALEVAVDDFNRALWLNGTSLLALVQELRSLFVRGASVFQISSRGSKLAVPNYVALGAPKALGEALVRYLAVELAAEGVRVNTVSCSSVLTDAIRTIRPDAQERAQRMAALNPSGRNVDPADVGALVYRLAGPDLAMLTGREFFLDGGIYITTE